MINLTQRHIITIIDLLKKEEEKLEHNPLELTAGKITIDNWNPDAQGDKNPKVIYLKELRLMLESEMAKATFTFGLNEKVSNIA